VRQAGDLAAAYDRIYSEANHYRYRPWMYRPFIKAIVKQAGIKKGSSVLDVGCGQGLFTSLLATCGMNALGIDLSPEGIKRAKETYSYTGAKFAVENIQNLQSFNDHFDCVYSRSLTLYNRSDFSEDRSVSDLLMRYVKPGGVLIFDYYTKLAPTKRSPDWLYHSLDAAKKHFSFYPGAKVYFSLRLDTVILGKVSFATSRVNAYASRVTGMGGDLVAIVPKR
jgi:SAM-dependent methyltransferase